MNRTDKPKLTSKQLVQKLRDEKGVTFKNTSENDAEIFLRDRNNYMKTASYGCAHNNCILADLSKGSSTIPPVISQKISKISDIAKDQRIKKLSSRTILEFVAMLYLYDEVVSEKVKFYRIKEIKDFFKNRMIEKKGYFKENLMLASSYDFVKKVIYSIYP